MDGLSNVSLKIVQSVCSLNYMTQIIVAPQKNLVKAEKYVKNIEIKAGHKYMKSLKASVMDKGKDKN